MSNSSASFKIMSTLVAVALFAACSSDKSFKGGVAASAVQTPKSDDQAAIPDTSKPNPGPSEDSV